ncbi:MULTISPECIES: AI-2E family transporter [Clostridium]|uniref:Permease n=1 Tax=Clostridium disporicum TaxID=84024 RepID=A0A173YMY9_9CLOT|nr:AI-2E family transporter [Clostridium sp.]CUN64697.1 permease [Clostridium disporicum]
MIKRKYKSILIKICIVLIFILLLSIYFFYDPVRSVVNLILISFIIAYAIKPLRNYFCDKFKISKRISSLIIIILSIGLFTTIIYFIVPTIIYESGNFGVMLDNVELYLMNMANKLNLSDLSLFETAYIQINEKINLFLASLSGNLIDNIASILENLVGFAIVPVVAYYFLADGELIYNKLLLIFPTDKRILIRKINGNIDKVLSRYIISQLLLSGIIGVLTFIMLIILGIKLPLILAILNAIANIIPYFGPIIGGAPIVFIALMQSPTKAILALIGAFVIQQIEGDLLAPKITGVCINFHPIIIIILLILGGKIGGAAGMILAVPILVIIKVIYDDINYYLF